MPPGHNVEQFHHLVEDCLWFLDALAETQRQPPDIPEEVFTHLLSWLHELDAAGAHANSLTSNPDHKRRQHDATCLLLAAPTRVDELERKLEGARQELSAARDELRAARRELAEREKWLAIVRYSYRQLRARLKLADDHIEFLLSGERPPDVDAAPRSNTRELILDALASGAPQTRKQLVARGERAGRTSAAIDAALRRLRDAGQIVANTDTSPTSYQLA